MGGADNRNAHASIDETTHLGKVRSTSSLFFSRDYGTVLVKVKMRLSSANGSGPVTNRAYALGNRHDSGRLRLYEIPMGVHIVSLFYCIN